MIINKGASLILKFNKFFYSKESILVAREAYTNFCDIKIQDADGYFMVALSSFKKDLNPETLSLELSNYILSQQS
jgi:hypothetical protein